MKLRLPLEQKTDSYKPSHWLQTPPGLEYTHSYFESRPGARWVESVFFGLQYILRAHLDTPDIQPDATAALLEAHFGNAQIFNKAGWQALQDLKGALPLRIRAVPEGTVVEVDNVLMTVENTHPDFGWLPNYLESLFVQVWYSCTVATQSRVIKRLILQALERSGTPSLIDYKLHDFGFRGSTSVESSAIGGAAHLVNFLGTDTIPALALCQQFYGAPMAGHSIPAAEHFTITSWGREHEVDAFRNMLAKFPGMVAIVSDSYNVYAACRELWGVQLRDEVLNHAGVVVIRPDSGNPTEVLDRVLTILANKFGCEENAKGYAVLHPQVRVIQGDGIDVTSVEHILGALMESKWSADNLAFGSGGGLLQKVNRDTQRFAFKASYVSGFTDGQPWARDVQKSPATDMTKASKAGRLGLMKCHHGGYETVRLDQMQTVSGRPWQGDCLQTVYEDGIFAPMQTLAEIRERARV